VSELTVAFTGSFESTSLMSEIFELSISYNSAGIFKNIPILTHIVKEQAQMNTEEVKIEPFRLSDIERIRASLVMKSTKSAPPATVAKDEPAGDGSAVDRGRVAIFIDGGNLFLSATQHLQFDIDFTKILPALVPKGKVVKANYYSSCDTYNEKQQRFFHMLRCTGYKVITKELQQGYDSCVRRANMEVEIAVDMLNMADHNKCDTIILVCPHNDLFYAAESVCQKGIRLEVVSSKLTPSDSLVEIADRYIDLNGLRDEISKNGGRGQRAWTPNPICTNRYEALSNIKPDDM
jgi:uncharacterized LabA/DUF88 family protein